jgi:endonuclease YncB( thermonuclease family)
VARIPERPRLLIGAAVLGLLLSAQLLPSLAQIEHERQCTLQAGPIHAVVRVIDAETVLLDDNREVRLIGALAPRSPDMSPGAEAWPPEEQAAAALRDLVLGRSVELAYSGRRVDRYGRRLAHLFLDRDGERIWVQGRLLSSGHARAYGLPRSFACMRELKAHERVAREAKAGLWSNAAYATRSALRPAELMRRRNSYEIVAGRVVRVVTTKSRVYLNFGSDWRRDFTAGVGARLVRANPALGKKLAALEGRLVEVRGWIEYRNGPYIDVEDASQIEAVEEGPRPPPSAPGGPTMSSEREPPPQKQERPAQKRPGALDL